MAPLAEVVARNLAAVRARIAAAAARCGRQASDIRLVAVTKYVDVEVTRALVDAGCLDLGESRPQALWQKAAALDRPDVRWHLVGHLQRNKVARTLPLTWLVHSIDSERLLAAVDGEAERLGRRQAVLLEVNVSGEAAKHGLSPAELPGIVGRLGDFRHVDVRGLMAMAGLEGDAATARADFARLRRLRDEVRAPLAGSAAEAGTSLSSDLPRADTVAGSAGTVDSSSAISSSAISRSGEPGGGWLAELSMGMSGDYEIAIEEGATIVRVGSALFEGLDIGE